MQRRQRQVEGDLVRLERRGAAGEEVEDRVGREPRGDEALVHPVARDGVDQPSGVAEQQRPLAGDRRARAPQRQPVAAQALERLGRKPVRLAHAPQVLANPRALALPGADADVRVVGLREHPTVSARNVRELDHHAPRVAVARDRGVGHIALVGDAVDDPAAEPDRPRGDPVRPIGPDNRIRVHPLPIAKYQRVAWLDLDARSLAHLRPALARRVEEERVEPPPLRHQDDRLPSMTDDRVAVTEAELDDVDLLLHDRRRVDGALPDGPQRQPAAARLVARKARLVDDEHGGSGVGEAVGERRSGGPAADDDRVEPLHEGEATTPTPPANERLSRGSPLPIREAWQPSAPSGASSWSSS